MSLDLTDAYRAHVAHLTEHTTHALVAEGYDAVAIHSGTPLLRSTFDDQYWPLRPVPHFAHWAHLEWPDCLLHLRVGHAPRLLVLKEPSFWESPRAPDFELLAAGLELVEVTTREALREALLPPNRWAGRLAFVSDRSTRGTEWGIAAEDQNPVGLLTRLDELRVKKTPYELHCLREANQIAALGHQAVADAFWAGERSELKLHLTYLEATLQDDPETPYKNIVALGGHAAVLHHIDYGRKAVRAGSLLLDAGATYRGYASDISRTYVAQKVGPGRELFAELVLRMEELQQTLCERATPGRPYESLHDEAHLLLSSVLVESGLVRTSITECLETGISRQFLPHGLGHSLGLQTHDVGCARIRPRAENPHLRNTRTIEADQVFTIEPGLYFIDGFMEQLKAGPASGQIDWAAVEAVQPFGGIRIEDDLVVTAHGTENLTRAVLQT